MLEIALFLGLAVSILGALRIRVHSNRWEALARALAVRALILEDDIKELKSKYGRKKE